MGVLVVVRKCWNAQKPQKVKEKLRSFLRLPRVSFCGFCEVFAAFAFYLVDS